jgi:multidrug transporter EmrE-like cation transporter
MLFVISALSFGQNAIRFDNIITNDTIYIFRNDKVAFLYHGYLNQLEYAKGYILNINDSIITLSKKILGIPFNKKKIKISNIYGFKKYTIIYRISKTITIISFVAASIAIPQIMAINTYAYAYALSTGIGLTGAVVSTILFNDTIKNTTKNGWKTVILYPK